MANIFLTKAEVLNFAAKNLESMANDARVAMILTEILKPETLEPRTEKEREEVEKLIVLKNCPVNQPELLGAVATDLRNLALEYAAHASKREKV